MLLSVVVTIYNIEAYLEKCIESIINQHYKELEIILVDDGSTDKSGEICDGFCEKDDRIKVYHTMNQGAAAARKLGVEKASGECIAFIDGDDWIDTEMYQYMMELYIKHKADLVTSGLIYEWPDKKKEYVDSIAEGIYTKKEIKALILPGLLYNVEKNAQGILASASNKIFSTELLKEIICNVDEKIVLGEDGAIVYPYAVASQKIVITHRCWYHYIQHSGSVMNSMSYQSFEKIHVLQKNLQQVFYNLKKENYFELQIKKYIGDFLESAVNNIYSCDLSKISFLFPYETIPQKSKVILYGAGKVGQSFWRCIKSSNYAELVSWVDKNLQNTFYFDCVIESPESILCKKYDYVVVAIEDSEVAHAVIKDLLDLGVEEQTIIWKINRVKG